MFIITIYRHKVIVAHSMGSIPALVAAVLGNNDIGSKKSKDDVTLILNCPALKYTPLSSSSEVPLSIIKNAIENIKTPNMIRKSKNILKKVYGNH